MLGTALITALLTSWLDPILAFENYDPDQFNVRTLLLNNRLSGQDREAIGKMFADEPRLYAYYQQTAAVKAALPKPKEKYLLMEMRAAVGVGPAAAYRARTAWGEPPSAVAYETQRRISQSWKQWTVDKRIDLLVEAAVLSADRNPTLTRELANCVIGLVRPIAEKYTPSLIKPLPGFGSSPRCYPFAFPTLDDPPPLKTAFGQYWELETPRACVTAMPFIKADNADFRMSHFLLRDGCSIGHHGPRGLLVFDQSVVVSNGPLEIDELKCSMLVSDGSVHFTGHFYCIEPVCVVSNDSIRSHSWIGGKGNTFIARKKIKALQATSTQGSTLIAGEEIDLVKRKGGEFGTHLVGKDKFDPGVRFFAVADVGLDLQEVDGKVVVKTVAEDSPFRKSLKPGDRINSVNDKYFPEFDDCRRRVREACVVGYAFVNRTRDGQHARVLVDLLGYPKPLKAK